VTGDAFLLFPAKLLLYSLLRCYCLMEQYFSEVKKTSDSFTYELQLHGKKILKSPEMNLWSDW